IFAQPFMAALNPISLTSELSLSARPILAMDSSQTMYRLFTTIYNVSLRPNHPLIDGKQSAQIYSPLGIARNEDYLFGMSSPMLNLANVRYYTEVSYPQPEDDVHSHNSYTLDLFHSNVSIPPTNVDQIEIISYGDNIANVADGSLAGEITLSGVDGTSAIVPLRVGVDTGDWAYDGLAATSRVEHRKPTNSISFPAFLPSVGHSFDGLKYVTRQKLAAPLDVTTVSAHSNLPNGDLFVEHVALIDESGRAVSLAKLAHKDEFALEFKSHAVALYENRDVMPRAFIVHQAQVVNDDEALARLKQPDFAADQVILLAEGKPLNVASNSTVEADRVSISSYQAERVVIQATTAQSGYLLLADSFYPGWEATLDGQRVLIHRADYAYRAVELQPGEHTIVFEFHPFSFTLGAMLSGLSLVLLFVLTVLGNRQSKSRLSLNPLAQTRKLPS
ncbi:MAG TPA: YfhO family protein, partial [Anaerolineae bacterium]